LAVLRRETGAEVVWRSIASGVISAANWAEVLQKATDFGGDAAAVSARFQGAGLEVEPVWREDAELAAVLWSTNRSLSLADRLCLATATRLQVVAVTADRSWADADCEADVLVIR
jgi:ribonuclease VapC